MINTKKKKKCYQSLVLFISVIETRNECVFYHLKIDYFMHRYQNNL